jgi:kynureninase
MPGAEGWQLSNPPILQLAALRASMDLFDRATMPALRRKGDELTGYLDFLLRARGVEVLTPPRRGSMLTVRFRKPGMVAELKRRGAEVDLRPPDIVRITPAPLYNSFDDVRRLCALIGELQDG